MELFLRINYALKCTKRLVAMMQQHILGCVDNLGSVLFWLYFLLKDASALCPLSLKESSRFCICTIYFTPSFEHSYKLQQSIPVVMVGWSCLGKLCSFIGLE